MKKLCVVLFLILGLASVAWCDVPSVTLNATYTDDGSTVNLSEIVPYREILFRYSIACSVASCILTVKTGNQNIVTAGSLSSSGSYVIYEKYLTFSSKESGYLKLNVYDGSGVTLGVYTEDIKAIEKTLVIPVLGVKVCRSGYSSSIIYPPSVNMDLDIWVNSSERLEAVFSPKNATNQNVIWSSSNEHVATVSSSGRVEAKKPGVAVITVTTEDGGYTATCNVKVKSVGFASRTITLTPNIIELKIGEQVDITATPDIWGFEDYQTLEWNVPNNIVDVSLVEFDDKFQTWRIRALKGGKETVTASTVDENGNAVKTTCAVTVIDLPTITTTDSDLKTGIAGTAYSHQFTATDTGPITWTYTDTLPEGLRLSSSGLLSGTPKNGNKATFTLKAENAYGEATKRFTLTVYEPAGITTASLKVGTIGKSYSVTLKGKGTKPLTWSAEGLPSGLSCSTNGKISGKATEFGTFTVKLTLSNGAGSTTKELPLTIKGIAPKLSGSLAKAELNKAYFSGLKLTKGSQPVTWSITGTLPEGLSLNSSTGVISGTPASYKSSGFKVKITASNGAGEKSKSAKLTVKGTKPKITTTSLPEATQGRSYSVKLTATGSEPITWAATNLPEGLTYSGDMIYGIPTGTAKSYKVKLTATNPAKSVKKTATLKVIEASDTRLPAMSALNKDVYSYTEYSGLPNELTLTGCDGYIVVAVLPEISVDVSGMYEFEVALSDDIPEGAELVYLANSDKSSDDDEIAEFFDAEGEPITAVPDSRNITLSVWLNVGRVYEPEIAIRP